MSIMANTKGTTATATDAAKTATGASIKAARERNAALDIDFSAGVAAADLDASTAVERGTWSRKLLALREGVEAGKGAYGTFYKLGAFGNTSGARTVIRDFEANPTKAPGAFDLKAKITAGEGGKRVSELWAAVIQPETNEAPEA